METKEFRKMIDNVHKIKISQFTKLRDEVDKRVRSKKIANILETDKSLLSCPFCKSQLWVKWGIRNDLQRYQCKNCKKTFNSLSNTPLARLRRKGHWLDYANCLKEGLTINEAAENCGIHKNTSFRWRHRFISNLKHTKAKKLAGIVESGHLSIKESFKGSNIDFNIKKRKNIFVIYGIDRNFNIFDITNKTFSTNTLNKQLSKIILDKSLLFSDKNKVYSNFSKENGYNHRYFSLKQ
ncbi:MAG: hypothetical protein N4A49_14165 [Marinifilaceae bacterium]|jgi:transposase-like protein|nr:hypothetical protein [Marinifilaceae bacterium]